MEKNSTYIYIYIYQLPNIFLLLKKKLPIIFSKLILISVIFFLAMKSSAKRRGSPPNPGPIETTEALSDQPNFHSGDWLACRYVGVERPRRVPKSTLLSCIINGMACRHRASSQLGLLALLKSQRQHTCGHIGSACCSTWGSTQLVVNSVTY